MFEPKLILFHFPHLLQKGIFCVLRIDSLEQPLSVYLSGPITTNRSEGPFLLYSFNKCTIFVWVVSFICSSVGTFYSLSFSSR